MLAVAVVVVAGIAALATFAHHESSQPVSVRYSVTGSAHNVDVTYSTWDNQVITAARQTGVVLPWQKVVTTTGFSKGGALTVTLGSSGGTATCSVAVQGKTYTATATGPFASAQCRGF
ncbi:hypothetical protein [Actinacidiphila acidipaludis]|uniref:Uncharacterized protein n=1 Tax=Actinacidiphila acidipaludis TaxID=2873382 RepID=A0ABS7Q563_9ACTN|nr:hypothetical protein [Streptomyces acidipaludis]MBY8878103.1 hypothetical protein [Streptomyces acidipaludis]